MAHPCQAGTQRIYFVQNPFDSHTIALLLYCDVVEVITAALSRNCVTISRKEYQTRLITTTICHSEKQLFYQIKDRKDGTMGDWLDSTSPAVQASAAAAGGSPDETGDRTSVITGRLKTLYRKTVLPVEKRFKYDYFYESPFLSDTEFDGRYHSWNRTHSMLISVVLMGLSVSCDCGEDIASQILLRCCSFV